MSVELFNPIQNGIAKSAFKRRTGRIKFIDIVPPIEQELYDSNEVNRVFTNYPFIPYSGVDKVTSHRMVSLLYNLKNMSTTFGGVLQGKKIYAIGKKIDIVSLEDLVFDLEDDNASEDTLPLTEKQKFVETLNKYFLFNEGNLIKLSNCESDSWDCTGQIGVEVITTKYLDQIRVVIKYHHPTDYCFLKNDNWGSEVVLSKQWDETYLKKYPPEQVPVYPLEAVYKDKSIRTFFFIKNGGYLYGRPTDMACMHDKYSEFKLKQYLSKRVKKNFMPEMIVEYEDGQMAGGLLDNQGAKDAGYSDATARINDTFTPEGDDPSGILITTRPVGAAPMEVVQVDSLRNAKDYGLMLDDCEAGILRANNYPELLYKLSGATGFSNDVFMDVFNIYNVTFNDERQTMLESFNNQILNYGFKKLGIENKNGIRYKSPIQSLLDEYNNARASTKIQSSIEDVKGQIKTNL